MQQYEQPTALSVDYICVVVGLELVRDYSLDKLLCAFVDD